VTVEQLNLLHPGVITLITLKRKLSVFIAISVDGYIARKDGDVSFLNEAEPIGNGEDGGFGEFFNSVDVLVMGRATFEKVLEFGWPYGEKPVIVLSNSLNQIPEALQGKVIIESGTPTELLDRLSAKGYNHIYLDGGKTIRSFLRENLVDEITLTTIPILLGEGLPLFGDLESEIPLRLLENKFWKNGFVQTKYAVIK
jgi:dihydrofolate reductase